MMLLLPANSMALRMSPYLLVLPSWTTRLRPWLDGRLMAKQESKDDGDELDEPAEESRSESDAAARDDDNAPRRTGNGGKDEGEAPESGTR